jgi:hypothetical protein
MRRDRLRRGVLPSAAWLWLATVAACKERNPDFDGPAATGSDGGSTSTSADPDTGSSSTGPVVTGDGTSSSSGEPPGTSSGEPGTSSGEPGSTTEACMGMVCEDMCIDPMTDNDHCGMCGNNCVGQQECIDGVCMVP